MRKKNLLKVNNIVLSNINPVQEWPAPHGVGELQRDVGNDLKWT